MSNPATDNYDVLIQAQEEAMDKANENDTMVAGIIPVTARYEMTDQQPYLALSKVNVGRRGNMDPALADKLVDLKQMVPVRKSKGGAARIGAYGSAYLRAMQKHYAELTKVAMQRRYAAMEKDFDVLYRIGLVDHVSPYEITSADVHNYLTFRRNLGLSESEMDHAIAALKPMLLYCKNNAVEEAFALYPYLKPKKGTDRLPTMSDELVDRIFECAMACDDDWMTIRGFAIPVWALATGMRAKELRLCNVDDLDISGEIWTAMVRHPKGERSYGKIRKVLIDPQAYPFLTRYLQARKVYVTDHGLTTHALFPGGESEGGYLQANTLRKLKCKAEEVVGEEFDLRICRRTYGQRLINKGVTIETVSKIMGHKNTMTTENYYGSMSSSLAVDSAAQVFARRALLGIDGASPRAGRNNVPAMPAYGGL